MHSSRDERRDRSPTTAASKRSAKIRLGQKGVRHTKRRARSRSSTRRPPHGRSEIVRTYRLWTRRDARPHTGHGRSATSDLATTTMPASTAVLLSTFKPIGTTDDTASLPP